jgi:hypothetical protein
MGSPDDRSIVAESLASARERLSAVQAPAESTPGATVVYSSALLARSKIALPSR